MKCPFSFWNAPEGRLNKIPRGYQQFGVCSRITKELRDAGPRGDSEILIIALTRYLDDCRNNCWQSEHVHVQVQKAVKKTARREQLQREEMEQRRLKTVLELQFILDQLGEEQIRQDLKRPDASGASLLTDADLASLDEFYKLVGPDRSCDVRYGCREWCFWC